MGENDTHAGGVDGVPEGLYAREAGAFRRGAGMRDLGERTKVLQESLNKTNETFITFVRERPLAALGAAIGIGYVFGRIFRRVV